MKTPFFFGWNVIVAAVFVTLAMAADAGALGPRDRCADIVATVSENPATIALQWNQPDPTLPMTSQQIFRRLQGAGKWVSLANLPLSATSYTDTNVSLGFTYEYFVYRQFNQGSSYPGTASGWLNVGIRAPLRTDRGKVILLVDDTMAAPLAVELNRFVFDLTGDGWFVIRQNVSRTATPPSIRATIKSIYQADPANTNSLILFGHIPVPYSGDYSQDSHPEHFGATPADVYYGDMDGIWTDTTVNDIRAASPRNYNIPGDGKFDQSVLPSDVELQVGRIDLANMPAFALSETELLRQYLTRNRAYRYGLGAFANIPRRGLVDDNFGFFNGELFAASGYRSQAALFGPGNIADLDWFTTLNTQRYLFAFGCGSGSYVSAAGVGGTTNFATTPSMAVFNLLYGSFSGDWDSTNNFLRAPLGGLASSMGLASASPGRPYWYLHPMGLGETIGYCAKLSQNNFTAFAGGYESNDCSRAVHVALMGDPTLRLHTVKPPANLTVQAGADNTAVVTWTPSADTGIEGYVVFRATGPLNPYARLSGALVTGNTFLDRSATAGLNYTYMVRAVKLESSNCGTYLNSSQGAFSSGFTPLAATGAEINVVANGQMIADDDTVPLRSNGTDFGNAEVGFTPVVIPYTIINKGTAPLSISSVTVTGENPTDFIVSSTPAAVPPGSSAVINVTFAPTALGPRSARLTINNNDLNEGTFDCTIGGTGIEPQSRLSLGTSALNVTMQTGQTASTAIQISNPANGTLSYAAASSLDSYSYRDSNSSGGPVYNWVDIATTGTKVTNFDDQDEGASPEVPLGIPFSLYGVPVPNIRFSTNGFLGSKFMIRYGQAGPLPNSCTTMSMIAPFWTDAYMDYTSGGVFWKQVGNDFVVQFENIPLLGVGYRRFTCQAIYKPTNEIIFQYKKLTEVGHSYSVGIQNAARDDGMLIAYCQDYLRENMAIRIRPPGLETWLSLPAATGTVARLKTQQIGVTLNTTGLAPGNYYAEVKVSSTALNVPSVTVPVRLTVTAAPMQP